MSELADQELVDRLLQILPSNNYQAADALGVAEGTIRRWRREAVGSLRADTRDAILAYLRSAEVDAGRARSPQIRGRVDEDEELRARLDAIEALELDDGAKAWKIAEIAAAYRAKALAELAAALRHEGQVAELRCEAARAQARVGGDESEGRRSRALVEEAVRTKRVPAELIEGKRLPDDEEASTPRATEKD